MQRDGSPNAGFTTADPWLPIAPDADRVNVAAQDDDPHSMFAFTRDVIRFRRRSNALKRGTYDEVLGSRDVLAFLRVASRERLLVALNFADQARTIRPSGIADRGTIVISTDPGRAAETIDLERLRLAPNEGVVIRLR
jgi:alpha-glucosidase